MLLKATGLALVILIAIGGVAGTAVFGYLYFDGKDKILTRSQAERTATAAYDEGNRDGEDAAKSQAEKCDVIVGGTRDFFASDVKAGETVSLNLQIRSSKSGTTYEVRTPAVCVVSEDLQSCMPPQAYAVGATYPPGCR